MFFPDLVKCFIKATCCVLSRKIQLGRVTSVTLVRGSHVNPTLCFGEYVSGKARKFTHVQRRRFLFKVRADMSQSSKYTLIQLFNYQLRFVGAQR